MYHSENPFDYNPNESMVILRNPLDRFISAFYYSKQVYPDCKLSLRTDITTPQELIQEIIKTNSYYPISSDHHKIGKNKTNISWVWCGQNLWYNNPKYVLFYETLNQDFNKFLNDIDHPHITLPKINSSYRPTPYNFSDTELEFIHSMYEEDYKIIDKLKKN
jgi:hypothetical protein